MRAVRYATFGAFGLLMAVLVSAALDACSGHLTDPLASGKWTFSGGSVRYPALGGSCAPDSTSECAFEVPGPTVSVNYLLRAEGQDDTGKTITATYALDADGAQLTGSEDGDPAYVTLHIEGASGGRWWHGGGRQRLPGIGVLTGRLDWHEWTGVYGQTDQAAFERDVRHLAKVGVTFGGLNDFGHGVYRLSGQARFRVLSYEVTP